jgi:IS30 family transposase
LVSLGLHAGEAFWVIAARLGKATSTVSREVAGNGGRSGDPAFAAIDETWRSSQLWPAPAG